MKHDEHLNPGQATQFVSFTRDRHGFLVSQTIDGIYQGSIGDKYKVTIGNEEHHLDNRQWLPCIAELEDRPPRIKSL